MNAVILCDKRTGSTFLQNALGNHPDVSAFDELFIIRGRCNKRGGQQLYKFMRRKKGMDIDQYLNMIFKKDDNVVFKLIYDQCLYWELLPILKKRKVKIIHLIRNNLFKRSLSKLTGNMVKAKKINIDINQLIGNMNKSMEKRKLIQRSLKGYKHVLTLYYEHIIGKTEGERTNIRKVGAFNITSDQITYLEEESNKKLVNFLNIEDVPMFCNITKKNTENIWDYISNKDEVVKELKRRKLAKYLS